MPARFPVFEIDNVNVLVELNDVALSLAWGDVMRLLLEDLPHGSYLAQVFARV